MEGNFEPLPSPPEERGEAFEIKYHGVE